LSNILTCFINKKNIYNRWRRKEFFRKPKIIPFLALLCSIDYLVLPYTSFDCKKLKTELKCAFLQLQHFFCRAVYIHFVHCNINKDKNNYAMFKIEKNLFISLFLFSKMEDCLKNQFQ